MLEIVAVTDNANDTLIYKVFDCYNEYYHIEKKHKKCNILTKIKFSSLNQNLKIFLSYSS